MNVPSDLKYVSTHEWVKINGKVATIGITDFAQEQLGDVTFVDLPEVGSILKKEQEMGAVESVKAASDLYSPVEGKIVEVNEALNDSPELVNSEPYAGGWIAKVELTGSTDDLMSADQYKSLISE